MPELPDVESFRRYLDEHATGRRIDHVEVPDPDVLRNTSPQGLGRALAGRRFATPDRHGKWLLARLDGESGGRAGGARDGGRTGGARDGGRTGGARDGGRTGGARDGGRTVVMHFGMTGYLTWAEAAEERDDHDHVVFVCDEGELRFNLTRKFGGVWLARDEREVEEVTGVLGPDARDLSRDDLADLLADRRGGLKSALMDQELVAGIGNIVADEVLWHARLHPRAKAASLDDDAAGRVYGALTEVLEESIEHGQVPRREDWLTHARDVDAPTCPRCGTDIEHGEVNSRSTYWCPSCQPAPR